jgi:site-specific recombinase XerD
LKPKSLDALEVTLRSQIYPYIGKLQIGALTAKDIQSMINKLVDKGLSYSTIKKAYDAINPCFKLGVINEEVRKNPCLGVVLPSNLQRKKSDIKFFTQNEIDLIYEECQKSMSREYKVTGFRNRLLYCYLRECV